MASAKQASKSKSLSNIPTAALYTTLSPSELGTQARKAAEEILLAGQAENTIKSYSSALRYWAAWAQARYGEPLTLPVSVAMAMQFAVDHLARGPIDAPLCELPPHLDKLLVDGGFKGNIGPLKMNTVVHRIAVLSKLHKLKRQPNPCEDPELRHLISRARRAASKRGETVSKKTAATREPLEAMLATCDGSLEGIRDRALLLFAWASGGRRRSEVAAACMEHLRKVDAGSYLLRLPRSKTNQDGKSNTVDKPIRGPAAAALTLWIETSGLSTGPIFRRIWKTRIGPSLSPAAIAAVVRRRATKAGIEGDWAGHSLRSGFVTEAGRRQIPIGDVMAMTEHKKVDTVMGYYRSGELGQSKVSDLLD